MEALFLFSHYRENTDSFEKKYFKKQTSLSKFEVSSVIKSGLLKNK